MNCELKRLKSFPPSISNAEELAINGFFFNCGPTTLASIQCHFCKIVINNWHEYDIVQARHKLLAPNCKLFWNFTKLYHRNKPISFLRQCEIETYGCFEMKRFTRVQQRLETFAQLPHLQQLAIDGFVNFNCKFYCFSCKILCGTLLQQRQQQQQQQVENIISRVNQNHKIISEMACRRLLLLHSSNKQRVVRPPTPIPQKFKEETQV